MASCRKRPAAHADSDNFEDPMGSASAAPSSFLLDKNLVAPRLSDRPTLDASTHAGISCPHCSEVVSIKTYQKHRRLYYNQDQKCWEKKVTTTVHSTGMDEASDLGPEMLDSEPESEADDEMDVHLPGRISDGHDDCFSNSGQDSTDSDGVYDDDNDAMHGCSEDEGEPDSTDHDDDEVWEEDIEAIHEYLEDEAPPLPEEGEPPAESSQNSLISWFTGFILLLQSKHYISDAAIDLLLKFMHVFFHVLSRFAPFIAPIARNIPTSMYMLRQKSKRLVTKYIVCPSCHRLYRYQDCITRCGSQVSVKICPFVRFPKHTQHQRRRPCGHLLLRTVQFQSGKTFFYPFKVFPYKSLQTSIQEYLLKPGFLDLCRQWKSRPNTSDLCDIYDGRLWKEFVSDNDVHENFLGLMINIDWFQPYKHTTNSVGVIYFVLINLPRSMRFRRENVIIVGVIPGPAEPDSHDIHSYLEPLVSELCTLWKGVTLKVNLGSTHSDVMVQCALMCVACDMPAGRKVCGFLGHSAKLGCSSCLKPFPGSVGNMDYSGFDRSQWPPRTQESHMKAAKKTLNAKTKDSRSKLESSTGVRYSPLLKLPYFNCSRMLIVDPMHNIFLGSGKRMLHLWSEALLLTQNHRATIQQFVNSFVVPADVGRIPSKIESGFSGFTADQFKNWIITYSIPALYGILPEDHMECWRHFVLASRLLCKRKLSNTDIILIDSLLMHFCTRVERIYGPSAITPNMHMHGHLKDNLLDYGPVHNFWLFGFERCNGILGNQPHNNRSIEPQLMHRFLHDNYTFSFEFPQEFSVDFNVVDVCEAKVVGSVLETIGDDSEQAAGCMPDLPSRCKRSVFSTHQLFFLNELFRKLSPQALGYVSNSTYLRYYSVTLNGKVYGSSENKSTPFVAMAHWDDTMYGPQPTTLPNAGHPDSKFRPVKIHYYVKASFSVSADEQSSVSSHLLAYVSWYYPHKDQQLFGKPAQLWCSELCERPGIHSFVPINQLTTRCAHCIRCFNIESLLVIVPLVE